MNNRDRGLRSGGAFNWYFQRISGVVLLFTLLAHFWVLHFFPPEHGNITFETVMRRLNHPAWRTVDLTFLVLGLYHGLNGLIIVVHDYIHRPGLRMALVGALWVAAIWFGLIGSMTILGLAGRGA